MRLNLLLPARARLPLAIATFCVLIAASIAGVVATFFLNGGEGIDTVLIAGYIGESGIAAASCLVAGAGIWVGLRLRSSVDSAFASAESEPDLQVDEG